jgi:hypothetical protein
VTPFNATLTPFTCPTETFPCETFLCETFPSGTFSMSRYVEFLLLPKPLFTVNQPPFSKITIERRTVLSERRVVSEISTNDGQHFPS